jgi:hypothetical protein
MPHPVGTAGREGADVSSVAAGHELGSATVSSRINATGNIISATPKGDKYMSSTLMLDVEKKLEADQDGLYRI